MDEIGIERARPALGEIVDRARFTGQPTLINRQGKPAAVIVNYDWYQQAKTNVVVEVHDAEWARRTSVADTHESAGHNYGTAEVEAPCE